MAEHNDLGKKGEKLAVEYLENLGYKILTRNYRFQKAEVDIIAQIEQTLIVVEVKTRSTSDFGDPQGFVKPKQIQSLVKAINHFVEIEQVDAEVRFDIIAVIIGKSGTKIEHIQDAFLYF